MYHPTNAKNSASIRPYIPVILDQRDMVSLQPVTEVIRLVPYIIPRLSVLNCFLSQMLIRLYTVKLYKVNGCWLSRQSDHLP